jgi:phosphoribosyl-AMP cyclohydrolase
MKGETSGNRLQVTEILVDCDDDTVLVKVKRLGTATCVIQASALAFFVRCPKKNNHHGPG